MSSLKSQLNVYIPPEINDYVDELKENTGLTKSEIIHLLLIYAKVNLSTEELIMLGNNMKLLGEAGVTHIHRSP
jgi:hypothetical protein